MHNGEFSLEDKDNQKCAEDLRCDAIASTMCNLHAAHGWKGRKTSGKSSRPVCMDVYTQGKKLKREEREGERMAKLFLASDQYLDAENSCNQPKINPLQQTSRNWGSASFYRRERRINLLQLDAVVTINRKITPRWGGRWKHTLHAPCEKRLPAEAGGHWGMVGCVRRENGRTNTAPAASSPVFTGKGCVMRRERTRGEGA